MENQMPEWQVRVIQERNELNEKCTKLFNFLRERNDVIGIDRELLGLQMEAMISYRNVLDERISRF